MCVCVRVRMRVRVRVRVCKRTRFVSYVDVLLHS